MSKIREYHRLHDGETPYYSSVVNLFVLLHKVNASRCAGDLWESDCMDYLRRTLERRRSKNA